MNQVFQTVDEYIASLPEKTQGLLQEMRKTIQQAAPEAKESISYGMPAYKLNGKPLVYFAAFARHIGFYATPTGHAAFTEDLKKYKQGKGSVQFPLSEPLPLELIRRIVEFRVAGNSSLK